MDGSSRHFDHFDSVDLGSDSFVKEQSPTERFLQMAWNHNRYASCWIYPEFYVWIGEKRSGLKNSKFVM
jgi:hypothetical protein